MTIPAWGTMWGLSAAVFAAFKALAWWPERARGTPARTAGFLAAWPGMDARAFLDTARRPARPAAREWLFALAKTAFGAALLWIVTPLVAPPLLRGWIGLVGMIFVLHFGAFHLASLAWRARGVEATPLMRAPILATSLADFWGRRWNLGFRDPAHRFIFAPLAPRVGPAWAAMAVFLASGLIHDLVISVPAGAGYGLPTAYFLVQGLGSLAERRFRIAGRFFTILVVAGPVYWLFHPPFVRHVIVPFLEVIA
jgi:hypothetical protein